MQKDHELKGYFLINVVEKKKKPTSKASFEPQEVTFTDSGMTIKVETFTFKKTGG